MENIGRLHTLDYLIIVGFFAVVIFIGFYFMKYIKQAKDYFAAGSSIPWWLAGISLWMAGFSALAFVVYGELTYKYGWTAVTLWWVVVPAFFIGGYYLAPLWRRARIITPLGFIENRYNALIRQIFVWTGIPLRVIDNAIRVYSTAIFLTVAVGRPWFSLTTCVILVSIIMVLYTYLGGQWAVIITDFVQAIILCLAVIVVFILTMIKIGGIGALVHKAPQGFFSVLNLESPYDWFWWFMFALLIFQNYNAGWGLVQKYNCVPTDKDARKVAYLAGALNFIGPVIFFLPAMAARVLIPELGNPRYTYVAISLYVLPVGMMGIMLAAMFSASLSTLGADYSVLSGILTNDFYKRVIKPDASEKHIIHVGRINTLIIGVLIMFAAIGLQYVEGYPLYEIMVKAFTAFAPAIMLPLLGGLLIKRINSRGALTGIVVGLISGLTLVITNFVLVEVYKVQMETNATLNYWLKSGFNSVSIGVNMSLTVLGMFIGSKLAPSGQEEREKVKTFFENMDRPFEPRKIVDDGTEKTSPFYIIGLTLLVLGGLSLAVGFAVLLFLHDTRGFWIDLIVSSAMILIGLILYRGRKSKSFTI